MKKMLTCLMLLSLLLLSCRSETSDSIALTKRVEWSHDCANMTLMLPEGWEAEEVSEEERIGLSLIPPEDFGGDPPMLGIYCYPQTVGRCGTVSRTDRLTLANGMETIGYLDKFEKSVGYSLPLVDTAGVYQLEMNVSEEFFDAYFDTLLTILGKGLYGSGFITESEAIARAESMRDKKSSSADAVDTVDAAFDISTGLWTVTYRNSQNGTPKESFVIDGRIDTAYA